MLGIISCLAIGAVFFTELESRGADFEDGRDAVNLRQRHLLRHAQHLEADLLLGFQFTFRCAAGCLKPQLILQFADPVTGAFCREQDESNLVGLLVLHDHGCAVTANINKALEDIVTVNGDLLDVSVLQMNDQFFFVIGKNNLSIALLRGLI